MRVLNVFYEEDEAQKRFDDLFASARVERGEDNLDSKIVPDS